MRHFEEGSICFVVRCLRGMERLWGLDKREGWGLRLEIPSKSLRVLRKPLPSCTRQGRATTPECELRVLGTPDRGRRPHVGIAIFRAGHCQVMCFATVVGDLAPLRDFTTLKLELALFPQCCGAAGGRQAFGQSRLQLFLSATYEERSRPLARPLVSVGEMH
jgi:hypothetical protein